MPPFNIDEVYAFYSWEQPGRMIEFTVCTVSGDVTGLITQKEAKDLVDRLFEHYPHWLKDTPTRQWSMTE